MPMNNEQNIGLYRSSNLSLTSRAAFRRRPASRKTSLLTKLFSKLMSTEYLKTIESIEEKH